MVEAEPVIDFAATGDRVGGAGKILSEETREHLRNGMIYPAEPFVVRNAGTTENRIDGLRFGFALHGDAIKFEHGEFVAQSRSRFRTENDRNAVILRLPFKPGCEVDRISEHRIV